MQKSKGTANLQRYQRRINIQSKQTDLASNQKIFRSCNVFKNRGNLYEWIYNEGRTALEQTFRSVVS